MDWLPHIVVKADADAVPATAATALKTFDIGFPSHKAVVHYVGTSTAVQRFCENWCTEGGHKFVKYDNKIRQSRLHYAIVKSSRLPVVLIRGTTIFYDNMSDYSLPKTKIFGGFIWPTYAAQPINDKKNLIRLSAVDKTVIFCSQPIKAMNVVNEITKWDRPDVGGEASGSKKWDGQTMVMDGEVYQQESGFFNMIYQWDPSLFSKFNTKTFGNYETVLHGNSTSTVHATLGELPEQEEIVLGGINAALNENYDELKGIMKTSLDSLAPYVVK